MKNSDAASCRRLPLSATLSYVAALVRGGFLLTRLPALCLLSCLLCGTARAATFEVDRTGDTNVSACTAAANDCDLRGALNAANGATDADTITFDATVFAAAQSISLDTVLPSLSTPITITGPGANLLTVKATAQGAFDIFTVANGVRVTLSGLTISDGITGIVNNFETTVTNCTLSGNTQSGINNESVLTATDCTLSSNSFGIVNNFDTTVTNCTMSGNTESGIQNFSTLTATNCTLSSNSTGIANYGTMMTLKNTLVAGNATNTLGTITNGGNNITSGTAAAAGLDPAGLKNNGGPTLTIALTTRGTAFNAGDNALAVEADGTTPLTFDQRGSGFPRIQHGTVDIGAFESSFPDSSQSGPNFVVNSKADTNDGICGVLDCTLREAIPVANANANTSIITFDTTVFGSAQTISLDTVLPNLSTTITVTGPGANLLTVKATSPTAFDIFTVETGVTAILSGLTISNGDSGINNDGGTVTVTNCTLSGNSGSGIYNDGTLTATNCTLSGNSGSGISNDGTLTATNCTLSRNFYGIVNRGTLTATNCTVTISYGSRGIVNRGTLTVTNCTVSGNSGSGIYNDGGTLTATNCTVSGNTLSGIFNDIFGTSGTLTATNCTVSGNGSKGIYNAGGTLTATNCTLSGNTDSGIFNGYTGHSSTLTATNCTVSGNSTGVKNDVGGTLTLKNTLCAGNTTNTSGTITDGGNNITSGTAAAAGLDPAGLKNNGGPTQTIALLAGGTAINAGNNALIPGGITTDQRGSGFPRIQGGTVDIGAFEAPVLTINNVTVPEGNGGTGTPTNAVFTVTLSTASSQTVTVNYSTADGTAKQPGDYTTKTGTLTFAPGVLTQTITVPVIGDLLDEAHETFVVNLSGATNTIIADPQGLGTVTDDDAAPNLSINDITVTEGNGGTATPIDAVFTVTLSAASGQTVTVNYSTADGTATQPGDYTTKTGTLTFVPGVLTQTLTVPVIGDLLDEANETFVVNLSGATNTTIADAQGVSTISDDDAAPSLNINDVTVTEGNSSTTPASFTATLAAVSAKTVMVNYAVLSGTTNPATVSSDFLSTKGTLTFAPGETTKTITVPIVGDYVSEADETFFVSLSKPVNVTIGDGQGLGTITNDDFDTTPPTVSFTTSTTTPAGTTPPGGGTVYNTIPAITGVAADAGTGVTRVQLRLYRLTSTAGVYEYWNGTAWVIPGGGVAVPLLITTLNPAAGGASVSWSRSTGWPTGSNLADGTYYLTAYAYDRAGKFASSSRNFKKATDTTVPSVSFTTSATTPVGTTPVNGSTISTSIPTITGVATDSGSGVAKVEVRLYRATATAGVYEYWTGTAWITTLTNLNTVISPAAGGANVSWSKSSGWPTGSTNFADGTYYLRATAYDKAGKSAVTLASSFKKVTSALQGIAPAAAGIVTASASDGSVTLDFTDQAPLGDFAVTVNGAATPVQSVERNGQSVTLMLPDGALRVGDVVRVTWPSGEAQIVAE